MLLKSIAFLILLLQCEGGFERIKISKSITDKLVRNDNFRPSLSNVLLANLTSNVLLNITTNVTLLSVISLTDLANITIMGHNNPIVNCNNSGGLLFSTCSNCVIEGISWKNCGTKNSTDDIYPVLQLFNSSNIVIENCSFEHSFGQAIRFSKNSGNITITKCNFLSNKQYKGHGSAIFYSLNISPLKITITSCKFSYNEGAKSVVYFGEPFTGSLYLQNSEFHYNKAVPIYLSNQDLHITGNVTIYNNTAENGGGIFSDHSNITIYENATVIFSFNTVADKGGAILLTNQSNIFVESCPLNLCNGNQAAVLKFYSNKASYGGAIYANHSSMYFGDFARVMMTNNNAEKLGGGICTIISTIKFGGHSTIICNNNYAIFGGAWYISTVMLEGNSIATISKNSVKNYGGSIHIGNNSTAVFEGNTLVTFNHNYADMYGGAVYIGSTASVIFKENSTIVFCKNNGKYGGAVSLYFLPVVTLEGNSTVIFDTNSAEYGGAIFSYTNSTIRSYENSAIVFNNNTAYYGGAVMINGFSSFTIQGNSTVEFNNSKADVKGGALHAYDHSSVTFEGSSMALFNNNSAKYGGAITINNSTAMFHKASTVIFTSNSVYVDGGTLFVDNHSLLTFKGSSAVACNNNNAGNNGGAMAIRDSSLVSIQDKTTVTFINNKADVDGGAVSVGDDSTVTFEGNSVIAFNNNHANAHGGAMFTDRYSSITFKENCKVIMNNNRANFGGAIFIDNYSAAKFEENCSISFNNNTANKDSGALYSNSNSSLKFQGNSRVIFYNNSANEDCGALYIDGYSVVMFEENTTAAFNNNSANYAGGAVTIDENSVVKIKGDCTVTFDTNRVDKDGGAMAIYDKSTIVFKENSTVTFYSNIAGKDGGGMDIEDYSVVSFEGNSKVAFYSNSADEDGGAMVIYEKSTIIFKEKSSIALYNNSADTNGGAIYIDQHSIISFEETTKIKFNGNSGYLGGAIFIKSSQFDIKGNASTEFANNVALEDGGGIYLNSDSKLIASNNSNITFFGNDANDYGGAIYASLKESFIYFNNSNLNFKDNHAGIIHKPMYLNVPKSCNSSCVSHSVYMPNKTVAFTTSSKLVLYNPAKCINENGISCDTYYMKNIMLGQQIKLDACVLDYFNQPIETATEFLITGISHQNYNIAGSKYLSILCNYTTQGISVIGNLYSNIPQNFSATISKHIIRTSELKVSVNLIIELSQCHLGFWYSNDSQKCECYNSDNIISCSDSNSTIKRGYWFGSVTGIYTVTSCPNYYCNFTCCEVNNGIYHLSPVRLNQCRSHRSGVACGNCEKGYTLSFDSTECVNINECTIAQTIMVTSLSFIYWIAVVVAVFAMMYCKITVGSLYAIIYYYSIIDILLGQVLFISNGLRTTVNIMSSLAKLNPQFLGQLCLVKNMSGIDQQFIHYVHPTVVLLILIMISVLARRSRRFSLFVGTRGIIHFICLLLLLSYASLTSTSLLLMRSLKFMRIDKIYTYLSPEIEYFHGRHLIYVIIAIIFTIVIVIGLPLLLLLEPFLNSKINFVKIKPLLDQFQCCYKNKYRWFAGYYMICRIVIILLTIVKISNDFTTQYLLLITCALMSFIHLTVQPYVDTFQNIFDGVILQFIVALSVLPIIEFVNYYDEIFVSIIVYFLTILPLASFAVIKPWINRETIRHVFKKCLHKYNVVSTNDVDNITDMNEIGIVADNPGRNATSAVVNRYVRM